MNSKKMFSRRFSIYLLLLICIAFLISTFSIYKTVHDRSINELHFSMETLSHMLEDRLKTIDKVYLLLEEKIEKDIYAILTDIHDTYRDNGHINFNLEDFLKEPEVSDVYIFNDDNQIIKTTDPGDQGLIFDEPPFSETLNNIRLNSQYFSQRTTLSTRTGEIKKYSYQGSFDKKYIFEVGYEMSVFKDILQEDSFANLGSVAIADFDYINNIRVYNHFGNSYNDNSKMNQSQTPKRYEAFNETRLNMTKTTISLNEKNYNKYFLYLPYTIGQKDAENAGFVIEIEYTDKYIKNQLRNIFIYQGAIVIFFVILLSLATYYFNIKFISPLKQILHGIESVSEDNLDTQIDLPVRNELRTVSNAFNEMTLNLKYTMLSKDKVQNQLKEALKENKTAYFETIRALSNAIDAKDNYTYGHCDRVMEMSLLIGEYLGLDDESIEILKYASVLHDIGKIGIDDSILNKKNRYTAAEYEVMKQHPLIGYSIIEDIGFLEYTKEIVLCHHERIDGNGYPRGLQGNEIPYLAKIISITDAFDAMTSKRIYKSSPMTVKEAFNEMIKNKSTQFDALLVDSFIEAYTKKYGTDLNIFADVIEKNQT